MSIGLTLKSHHTRCDDLFVSSEQLCVDERWDAALPAFERFCTALEGHLSEEENIVFPAFEAATGMTEGPTQVMRTEHAQMRALVAQIDEAIRRRDAEAVAGAMETLVILMQQHNLKEEHILYPMFDQVLAADEIVDALLQYQERLCPN